MYIKFQFSAQPFGAAKPTGFGLATTTTPSFNFAAGNTAGTSMFGNTLNKPGGLGTFGSNTTTGKKLFHFYKRLNVSDEMI